MTHARDHRPMATALAIAATLLAATGCRDDPPPKREADGLMCGAGPDPAPACGGEWCAEHGVPEAECTVCNPDAGVGPSAPR